MSSEGDRLPNPDIVIIEGAGKNSQFAHGGMANWYAENQEKLVTALAKGPAHVWTTGWYGGRKGKELVVARIVCKGGRITAEVRVTEDFCTLGEWTITIPFTQCLATIREAINRALTEAIGDQEDNGRYV